jgi:hypothetical protein
MRRSDALDLWYRCRSSVNGARLALRIVQPTMVSNLSNHPVLVSSLTQDLLFRPSAPTVVRPQHISIFRNRRQCFLP